MATFSIDANPGRGKRILYGMWLQSLVNQYGVTDPNLQPSLSDSGPVVLSKILTIYKANL